jgi:hypothetical protein
VLASEHAVASTSLERHLIYLLDAVEPAAGAIDGVRSNRIFGPISSAKHRGPRPSGLTSCS